MNRIVFIKDDAGIRTRDVFAPSGVKSLGRGALEAGVISNGHMQDKQKLSIQSRGLNCNSDSTEGCSAANPFDCVHNDMLSFPWRLNKKKEWLVFLFS